MEIIFLGTGTSQGVPLLASDNKGLDLKNSKNWRTRSSIHLIMDGYHVQVDAGPEFRLQCLHNKVSWIDLFLLTHEHADHLMGMDDLRRFCEITPGEVLKAYSSPEAIKTVEKIFPYALLGKPARPGYPAFDLKEMPKVLEVPGGWVYSTFLPHGNVQTLGFVFVERSTGKKAIYYNDCKVVTPEGLKLAEGADIAILEGLTLGTHHAHMTIQEAVEVAQKIKAPTTYLTHLGASIDFDSVTAMLPTNIELAYDGLRIQI